MATIHKVTEGRRGCGFRQKGGFYLRTSGKGFPCEVLPILFKSCDHCGATHTPNRSFSWCPSKYLFYCMENDFDGCGGKCEICPMQNFIYEAEFVVLDWVGVSGYKNTSVFNEEAKRMGISRRIPVRFSKEGKLLWPVNGFELGRDWIALCHKGACNGIGENGEAYEIPGVFKLWQPQELEYVIKGDEEESFLNNLEEQGVRLVDVSNPTQGQLFDQ